MKTIAILMILICVTIAPSLCQEPVDATAPPVETISEPAAPAPAPVAENEEAQPKSVEVAAASAPSPPAQKKTESESRAVTSAKSAESPKPKTSSADKETPKASVTIQETAPVAASTGKGERPGEPKRQDRVAMMAEHKAKPASAGKAVGDWSKTVLVTLLKLGFVLALAYVTILALKWISAKRESAPQAAGDMKIVETLALPTGGHLHVVSIHGKSLLIASAAGHVSLLSEFEPTDEPLEVKDAGGRFAAQLEKYYAAGQSTSPAGRIAGLLRDCSAHLQRRRHGMARSGRGSGESNES